MRVVETKVYSFDELSEENKQKAIENLWNINIDFEWYEFTYQDAKDIGCEISGFDIDRGNYCDLKFVDDAEDIASQIIESHGEKCETFKTAKQFLSDRDKLVSEHSDGVTTDKVSEDNEYDFDNELFELEQEFGKSLSEDYRIMLSNEYDYQTSEEAIIETIEADQYEFTEDGKLS